MNRENRWFEWLATASFILMGISWTYIFGKDLNFDFRNYHLYAGAQLLDWRINQDYFPAAVGGYLNPLSALPAYAMIMAGWPDFLIAAALMLMHLPNMLIVWKLAELVVPGRTPLALFSRFTATFLAFIAPLQLTTLSNTFADPLAGTFTLLGLYLLLSSDRDSKRRSGWVFFAGSLFGLGAGLKLTNLFFVLGGFLTLALGALWARKDVLRPCLGYVAGSATGFLAIYGYWGYALWVKFGNPIFPLYNALFKSPEFLHKNFADGRMLHDGNLSWLTLPITMLSSRGMMYAENPAPDIRLLSTVLVAIFVALAYALRHNLSRISGPYVKSAAQSPNARMTLGLLTVFFLSSYLVWGILSGIGRYAFVLWLLLGPILLGILFHYTTAPVTRCVTIVVITIQLVIQFLNPGLVWSPHKWGGKWVNLEVPAALRDQPATYLLYGTQSNSFIIPYLHRDSKFSNFIGQYVQPVGPAMHHQFQEFLNNPVGPLRIVFSVQGTDGSNELKDPTRVGLDSLLSGYGYKIKSSQCHAINLMGEPLPKTIFGEWQVTWAERESDLKRIADTSLVCDITAIEPLAKEGALSTYQVVDGYFDAVERACGNSLSPHGVQTFNGGGKWYRVYFNSLMVLALSGDDIWVHPNGTLLDIPIAQVSKIKAGAEIICPDIKEIKRTTNLIVSPSNSSENLSRQVDKN